MRNSRNKQREFLILEDLWLAVPKDTHDCDLVSLTVFVSFGRGRRPRRGFLRLMAGHDSSSLFDDQFLIGRLRSQGVDSSRGPSDYDRVRLACGSQTEVG